MKNTNQLPLTALCRYAGGEAYIASSIGNNQVDGRYTLYLAAAENLQDIRCKINEGKIKLQLKPLSSITEEGWMSILNFLELPKLKISQMFSDSIFYSYKSSKKLGELNLMTTEFVIFNKMSLSRSGLIDKLRVMGYDCDNLIQDGFAIPMDIKDEEDPLFDSKCFTNPISENLKGHSNE